MFVALNFYSLASLIINEYSINQEVEIKLYIYIFFKINFFSSTKAHNDLKTYFFSHFLVVHSLVASNIIGINTTTSKTIKQV